MIHLSESADSLRGWMAAGKLLQAASDSVVWELRTGTSLNAGRDWASSVLGKCCPNSKNKDCATENDAEISQIGHAVGLQPIACPF